MSHTFLVEVMSRSYLVMMPRAEARHLAGLPGTAGPGGGDSGAQVAGRPVRGPFAPGRGGLVLPGRVEYLGGGIVRLDEEAIGSLAELGLSEDFRVVFEQAGPVLIVGPARYLAQEEEPEPQS